MCHDSSAIVNFVACKDILEWCFVAMWGAHRLLLPWLINTSVGASKPLFNFRHQEVF